MLAKGKTPQERGGSHLRAAPARPDEAFRPRILAQYMGRKTGLTRARDGNKHMGDLHQRLVADEGQR